MRKSKLLIAALPAIVLGGCTTHLALSRLAPEREGQASLAAPAVQGLPYALYYDKFDIIATYQIASCTPFKLAVTAELDGQSSAPDPDNTYLVDPGSLASFLKTSDVAIAYNEDGSVASLNAEAEDQTAKVVVGLGKAAAQFIGLSAIPAGPAAMDGQKPKPVFNCSEGTTKAFNTFTELDGALDKAKAKLEAAQNTFDVIKAQLGAAGAAPSPVLIDRYGTAMSDLQLAVQTVEDAQKAQKAARAKISFVYRTTWPQDGKYLDGRIVPVGLVDQSLSQWLGGTLVGRSGKEPVTDNDFELSVAFEPTAKSPLTVSKGNGVHPIDPRKGIPYRSPVPADLVITDTKSDPGKPVELLRKPVQVKQLGRIAQLDCTSRPLTSVKCAMAFDKTGRPTKLGYARPNAPGADLSTMLGGLADAAGSGLTDLAKAKAARDGRQKAQMSDELALLELQAKIAAARKALQEKPDSEQTLMQHELDGLELERKLLEARKALAEAKAKPAP